MTLNQLAAGYGLSLHGLVSLSGSQTFKVSRMLSLLVDIGDKLPVHSLPKTIFHQEQPLRSSVIVLYLQMTSNAGLQDEQAILVLILIERLCLFNTVEPQFIINSHTIFR
jgi:hypothetical protein